MTSITFLSPGQRSSGVSARLGAAALAAVFAFAALAGAQQTAQPSSQPDQAQQTQPSPAGSDSAAQPASAAATEPAQQPAQQPAQAAPQAEAQPQPAAPAESSQSAPATGQATPAEQAPAPAAAPSPDPASASAPNTTPGSAPAPAEATPPAPAGQETPAAAAQAAPSATDTPSVAAPAAPADQAAAPGSAAPAEKAATSAEAKPAAENPQAGAVSEEDLRRMLVGKSLYLRGGYLDNNLTFGETGQLIGHSPIGSYTLSGIQIDHVRLTKHKVELEGARYGLHFLGSLPYEDPTKAVDRVKITPKKKFVKITIDRELVVTPKKKKEKGDDKNAKAKTGPGAPVTAAEAKNAPAGTQPTATVPADSAQAGTPMAVVTSADSIQANSQPPSGEAASAAAADSAQAKASAQPDAKAPAAGAQSNVPTDASAEPTDEDQAKAELTSGPKEERPADPGSVTTTTSPAHASKILKDALEKIFAPGLDEQMMASMPEFWKLYYEAAAAKTDYRPKDPTVMRQSAVDEKAKLTSKFEPESNDFAQDAGVAGMCLYHTVIGADGRPSEIAVARPIGFGLDEKAVEAIRKASFQPAMKDGKPVPVLLDLVVQFRIYSKRTNVASKPEDKDKPAEAQLPGPYTLQSLHTMQAQNPNPSPAQSQ